MPEGKPLISIGMPVFNNAGTLREAVHSIILQGYQNWELLIMDDGSTDGSLEIARAFSDHRVRVVADGENRGLAARMNQAVQLSRGELFARMDADDIAYPQRLAVQLAYLQQHPNVDLLGCGCLVFSSKEAALRVRVYPETHAAICASPWFGMSMVHPSWIGKISWFRQFPYNEKLKKAQDQELLLRTFQQSRFANLPEILMGYREDQTGLKKTLLTRWYLVRALIYVGSKKTALLGVATQSYKMMMDLMVSVLGLRPRLVQRRSNPASSGAIDDWLKVMQSVQNSCL